MAKRRAGQILVLILLYRPMLCVSVFGVGEGESDVGSAEDIKSGRAGAMMVCHRVLNPGPSGVRNPADGL